MSHKCVTLACESTIPGLGKNSPENPGGSFTAGSAADNSIVRFVVSEGLRENKIQSRRS